MKKMTILIFFVCGVFFPPVFAQDSLEVSDREFKEMLVSALNHIDSLNEKIIAIEIEIGTLSALATTYGDQDRQNDVVKLDEISSLSNELDHLKAVKKGLWNGLILLANGARPPSGWPDEEQPSALPVIPYKKVLLGCPEDDRFSISDLIPVSPLPPQC